MKRTISALALAALLLTGCSSSDDFKSSLESADASVWTAYDTTWSKDFQGLKMEITQAALTDKAPKVVSDTSTAKTSSAVAIKFKMTNTTQGKFTTFPNQAKLTTSTGLVLDSPHGTLTNVFGGVLEAGAAKEGDIIWVLQPGQAQGIEWITIDWWAKVGDNGEFGTKREYFTAKLELKK